MTVQSTQRRTNAERRAASRSAVLDATVKAIVSYGYQGATSARIAELSGFTRGAQKYHFKNKAEMVAEALVHLHENLMQSTLAAFEKSAEDGLFAVLEALWASFQDDVFTAAAELRVAARIDVELKTRLVAAEQQIGRRIRVLMMETLDDGQHSPERLRAIGDHIVNVMRGMASQSALYPNPDREQRQLRVLHEAVCALLEAPA
ncbi:TetR family transcriptional regulator [Tamaricihabitans halophyticus]|uniref:TetR family transcriptional regulator n=1 Tax=Tamaricihabitans halophyticus TaxID=1262583 RepID=A0A4R2QLG6_9PSEU|nr:TetR/AcrR family transcriptional regulator [Tamaricihabitans halophyticus]TCP49378.1 TetR family transcriptional regulator [Tamaricihabitans halophyticus]